MFSFVFAKTKSFLILSPKTSQIYITFFTNFLTNNTSHFPIHIFQTPPPPKTLPPKQPKQTKHFLQFFFPSPECERSSLCMPIHVKLNLFSYLSFSFICFMPYLIGFRSASFWASPAAEVIYAGSSALSSTTDANTSAPAAAYACPAEFDFPICQ